MKGIIGKKIGMTSIFGQDGKQIACTIIEAGPCTVTQVKTLEIDGYSAVQLALGDKKEKHSTKSEINHYAKAQTAPKRFVKEFRNYSLEKALGETVTLDIFEEGDAIEVVGTTKGKGFQGVVRRHGFAGVGQATHGQHNRLRAPGSIGACSYPARVFKGMRMAGQMGNKRRLASNLQVLKVIAEKNLVIIKGSIPGPKKRLVTLTAPMRVAKNVTLPTVKSISIESKQGN